MATQVKNVYRKTSNGKWAVMGPVEVIRSGATVTVHKNDGSTKTEVIQDLGKPFRVDGRDMVYGYPTVTERPRSSGKTFADDVNLGGRCKGCRQEIRHAKHHRAMGGYCGHCAFDEYDM